MGYDAAEVTSPDGLVVTVVEGREYRVRPGVVVELAVPESETAGLFGVGRLVDLAFPFVGSAFVGGPHVSSSDPAVRAPEIHVVDGTAMRLFAVSDGVTGPDESIGTLQFADPRSPYGDALFACSSSAGGGDGVFRIGPDRAFSVVNGFNN